MRNNTQYFCKQIFKFTVSLFLLVAILPSSIFSITTTQQLDPGNFNWIDGIGYHLVPSINAAINLDNSELMLIGQDALDAAFLFEGHQRIKPDVLVMKYLKDVLVNTIYYKSVETGHIETNDWEEYIDPDTILSAIKQSTKEDNKIREKGYPALYVDEWVQKPTVNYERGYVYWALSGHTENGDKFINAKALVLNRKGFVSINWVGSPDNFINVEKSVKTSILAYSDNTGFAYTDFDQTTDKVAAFGVGALAYKMLTGKNSLVKSTAKNTGAG